MKRIIVCRAARMVGLCATLAICGVTSAPARAQLAPTANQTLQPAQPGVITLLQADLVASVRWVAQTAEHTDVICSIKNTGSQRTGLFIARVAKAERHWTLRNGWQTDVEEQLFILDLAPGQEWSIPEWIPRPAGLALADSSIWVRADVQDVVLELNKRNNVAVYGESVPWL